MPETTATCACCGNVFPIRQMRFNRRESDKVYEYQCVSCRALIKSGELKR